MNISKPVWQKFGSQGNEWNNGQYYMDPTNAIPSYVVFEAIRGDGPFGDIALDDISIHQGQCPSTTG